MVLIAKSCGMARMRNGQKNQLANDDGTPVTAVTFGLDEVGGRAEELQEDRRDACAQRRGPERARLRASCVAGSAE